MNFQKFLFSVGRRAICFVLVMASFGGAGFSAFAQQIIKGTVISATDNQPLPGVSVMIKGQKTSASTDPNGVFTIRASKGQVLVFTFLGFTKQEIPVGNLTTMRVVLKEDNQQLDEVVVIGYGTQKKSNVTGAVATFNAEKLNERPVGRVDQAMVGQIAGVAVKQTNGVPGKGMSVQVRGAGSIGAGNEPLYVIDGFPLAQAKPNGSGNYSTGNPLDNINPNDIESVQVLKDASSAAIYGSRAANGVVIITTKKGKTGKPVINFNSYAGYNERSKKLDLLSGEEWIERAKEIINRKWEASGTGRSASQTNEQRRQILGLAAGNVNADLMYDDRWDQPGYPGLQLVDWQNELFRKGMVQNYQLSANGGTESVKYYIAGNYTDQDGMVMGMDYKAYSARANVDVTASSKLKFGLNISPTYSIGNDPGIEGKDNILHQMISMTPVQEASSGLYPNSGSNTSYTWSVSTVSPKAKIEQTTAQNKVFRTLSTLYGEYEILRGLSLKSTLNLDNTDYTFNRYIPYTIASDLNNRNSKGLTLTSGTYNTFRKQTFVNENTLAFARQFNKVHDVSAVAGFSYNSDEITNASMSSRDGYGNSVIQTLNWANAVTGNTTGSKNVLLSYFGRVQYAWGSKYLLSASVRRDGSSRFGENTKWGTFPSASVGWRVIEESFLKDNKVTDWLSDLKLRGSWGISGNYGIPDYGAVATMAKYVYSIGGASVTGQAPNKLFNPDLTWEESRTFDAGLDFGFFANRITGSFDFYNKENSKLLLYVPVSRITGFSTLLGNSGKVKNTGWELELTTRNLTGNFQWITSGNISHNSNKLIELSSGQSEMFVPSTFDISHSILKVGEPLYSLHVIKQTGILTQDDINSGAALYGNQGVGDPKYFDANGDKVIDQNDRVYAGKPNPSYTWGITNSFRYKAFDLSVLVQGQWGGSIYSLLGRAIDRTSMGYKENVLGHNRDRWRSPEDPGDGMTGRAGSSFGFIKNTDWLYASDYVRVRNITLGYNLGNVIKSKRVSGARLYITAENFFGTDKYDGGFNPEANNTNLGSNDNYPEAGDYGGLPLPKSLVFGVNFSF
ncbi:SusC/RagA family TonB-linked outer membrane protein [Pararcticibacter amylolyticus]|uniref:TonB-dependent receptor n=1 Tax=Pararcticibacter amylolyticus TaxID=2173175 RepID=A0A2U2PC57_9SPHI|nr:TonB-dependent receptor [Pararcticibacter amylolyticus]PWG78988.1 TonB-dependent receptor [Pararcticibacter amylolyticus]